MTEVPKQEKFRIVASDLDGTLLDTNHQLSEFSKETLSALHQAGFTFVFATGRHHVDVSGIRQSVGIPAYMITSNGARVHDQNDQVMFSKNVPCEYVQPVIDMISSDQQIFIHLYQDDKWLVDKEDQQLAKFHNQSGFSYTHFDPLRAPTESIAKIFVTHPKHDHDHLVILEDKLRHQFGHVLTIEFSTPWCLEIMAANVSKGRALEAVAKSLNLKLDNCIAFGDGMNDVEMLKMAGKGLVMATSHYKVKAALPNNEVIGSNANHAVAQYLKDKLH